jgi:adenosyl cobinamide kinase/adenosyl cobinamide phosphate guanylyltransferase
MNSVKEEKRLFANLPDWLRPVVIIASETGMGILVSTAVSGKFTKKELISNYGKA